ncbi:MAG: O-antigen ligase family protein [Candidatus Sericytochromatia bacterium]|nr:O-antigen ligase family protein [Candidatus Sericytochromatia bacterium]
MSFWLMPFGVIASAGCLLLALWREAAARRHQAPPVARSRSWHECCRRLPPAERLWLLTLAGASLATLASPHPLQSLPHWALAVGCAITFALARGILQRPAHLQLLLRALFQVAIGMSLFGLTVYAFDLHARWQVAPGVEWAIGTPDRRVNAVMYHPNQLAGLLVLALGAGLGLFHGAPPGRSRVIVLAGLLCLALTLLLTASRAGWLGAAVTLAAFGFSVDRRWWLAGGLAAATAAACFPQLIWARLSALAWNDPAFDHFRLMGWEAALKMIQARPWTGWGPGTWGEVYPTFRLPAETVHLPHAHNAFLHVSAEFGVPTLVFLSALVLLTLRQALLETRDTPLQGIVVALTCTTLGYAVTNCFDAALLEGRNAIAFFLLLGGAAAARRMPLLSGGREGALAAGEGPSEGAFA